MTRFVAFLRGVNLGRRQTKSADLKAVFEGLGFADVRTLIASGNVVFETDADDDLRQRIEAALAARFGFEIGVVLRTLEALRTMVASAPFAEYADAGDAKFYVLLAATPFEPLPELAGAPGDYDVARVDPRDIYLVGHRRPNGRYSEGLEQIGTQLPKGQLCTMRNWNTIEKAAR